MKKMILLIAILTLNTFMFYVAFLGVTANRRFNADLLLKSLFVAALVTTITYLAMTLGKRKNKNEAG